MISLHDGCLNGLVPRNPHQLNIECVTSAQRRVCIVLSGLTLLRATDFLHENIILDVSFVKGPDSSVTRAEVEQALIQLVVDDPAWYATEVGHRTAQEWIQPSLHGVLDHRLGLFRLRSAQGASVTAVCESATLLNESDGLQEAVPTRVPDARR